MINTTYNTESTVPLKYQDSGISYLAILTPAYLAAFLFGLRISALLNGL